MYSPGGDGAILLIILNYIRKILPDVLIRIY